MYDQEIRDMQQEELELWFLNKSVQKQIKGLPKDFTFDLMAHIELGTWYNIVRDITVFSEVKESWQE
jgi:hypothetical protein